MFETFIQIFTIVITIVVGLLVGSFLNVVIYRVPQGMSIATPPSHCPKCNERIKWYDNIPLISYIILKGKCRHCKEHISIRYPLVELTNCILWFLCLLCFTNFIIPNNMMSWIRFITSCVACSILLCIFFSDLDNMEIPDVFQIVLLLCGVVLLLEDTSFNTILVKVLGFVGAGALFIIVNLIFKGIKKRDGIGFGDVELIACAGLLLGGYNIIFALILSCVVGGLGLLIVMLVRKDKGREYPFAVLLVPGILIALFVGGFVTNWYLSLLGVM